MSAHVSIAKLWFVIAVVGATVATLTWAETARAGGKAVVGWTTAKAVREARRGPLVVDGRRVRVDPAALVCWGIGVSERRGASRFWRRFNCIAPTFHGAGAGPDLLFGLRPVGRHKFVTLNARFSAYQATNRRQPARARPQPARGGGGGHTGLSALEVVGLLVAALLVAAVVGVLTLRPRGRRASDASTAS